MNKVLSVYEVVVTEKLVEAENICSFKLNSKDGKSLPKYSAGAHIDVYLPNGLVRQYSLCNLSSDQGTYQIAVLNESNSRGGSSYMHAEVKIGSQLRISEPRNLFPLEENAKKSILIAGGIGVTPLLAMADSLSQSNRDFEFHYFCHSASRAAFKQSLMESKFANQCSIYIGESASEKARIAAKFLSAENKNMESHLYVCGPSGFIDFMLDSARLAGWPEELLHKEHFSNTISTDNQNSIFEVEIKSTGQIFEVPEEKRIIDILEDNDVFVPVACEEGICGTCLTGVVDGTPDHKDVFMNQKERESNKYITPCCSRALSPRIVLDL